jgi:hypothetical protein
MVLLVLDFTSMNFLCNLKFNFVIISEKLYLNNKNLIMEIRVNTDSHITGSESMNEKYATALMKKLQRFAEHITSVEIFFGDENGSKSGTKDKRCTIEVRPKNLNSDAVTHYSNTLDRAFNGAVTKVRNLLDTRFGKLQKR